MAHIYKITNLVNNKVYIGQTVSPDKRWGQHKANGQKLRENPSLAKEDRRYNMPIAWAIAKYGEENFEFEVLEEVETAELDEVEIYYISLYQSADSKFGYNATLGGQGQLREEISASEIEAITSYYRQGKSIHSLAKEFSRGFETIKRILLETKTPIRNVHEAKMFFQSDQWEEVAALYKELKSARQTAVFYGCDPDCVLNVIRRLGRTVYTYRRVARIENEEVVEIFDNCSAAGRAMAERLGRSPKGSANSINNVCNGKGKTACGFKWKFLDYDD